ncbi:MAG: Nif11-like leader peptide family RiPP precursor [Thermodesulfobacteriota bacterium]
MNSEEAADFLGVKPLTIRTYARRGVIPGKKLGNEWRFVKKDLLAWLKGMEGEESTAETTAPGAEAFLQRAREDEEFRKQIESLATDAERMAFVRKEGFVFTLQELQEAISAELGSLEEDQEPIIRRAQRYQVYLKVSELNGQPVTDTMILDINAWGARIGSFSPFDTLGTIEITFIPPGENQKVRISGEVVWSRLMPADTRYHAGVEFLTPLDQLHREGKI